MPPYANGLRQVPASPLGDGRPGREPRRFVIGEVPPDTEHPGRPDEEHPVDESSLLVSPAFITSGPYQLCSY